MYIFIGYSMYIISKSFNFEASHFLTHVPDGHPCRNLHGHSYTVELELKAYSTELLNNQWVKDFRELESFKQLIDKEFDHKHITPQILDKVAGLEPGTIKQTTSENIAYALYQWCSKQEWPIYKVTVSETPKSRASFFFNL